MMGRVYRKLALELYLIMQRLIYIISIISRALVVQFSMKNKDKELGKKWIDIDPLALVGYTFNSKVGKFKISEKEIKFIIKLGYEAQFVNKRSQVDFSHGVLLYKLVHSHPKNDLKIMEIGTAKGFSALCMSRALKMGNKTGIIFTNDIIPNDVTRYWNDLSDNSGKHSREEFIKSNYPDLRHNIMFISTTSRNLSSIIDFPTIDLWFFDGVHEPKTILREFSLAERFSHEDTIFVFDDCTNDYHLYKNAVEKLLQKKSMKFGLLNADIGRKSFFVASKTGIHNALL